MPVTAEAVICNMALSHLHAEEITTLEDKSAAGVECKKFYAPTLEAMLQAHAWDFATTNKAMTIHGDPPPDDWSFRMDYPSDCLRPLAIVLPTTLTSEPPLAFRVQKAGDGTLSIVQNVRTPIQLRYIGLITAVELFPPLFVRAFSWALSAHLAGPLTGKATITERMEANAQATLIQAITADSNAKHVIPSTKSGPIRARG